VGGACSCNFLAGTANFRRSRLWVSRFQFCFFIPQNGGFSPKFYIFGRQFFDIKNIFRQFSLDQKFTGRGNNCSLLRCPPASHDVTVKAVWNERKPAVTKTKVSAHYRHNMRPAVHRRTIHIYAATYSIDAMRNSGHKMTFLLY